RDSRLAVRSIAGRSSSGSTTTLIRTLVGSTGSRGLRPGASGLGNEETERPLGKTTAQAPCDLPGPGCSAPGRVVDAGQYTGAPAPLRREPTGLWNAGRRGAGGGG